MLLCFTVLWGTWFPKISELVQGNKVTVGAPFYNRVAIPVALLLLILTAVGPLLAWRKTSFESLKRNFLWPTMWRWSSHAIPDVHSQSWGSLFGLRPWQDIAYFYSLMAIGLSVLVPLTIASEYYRGGRVIAEKTGQGMFASMVQLTHRNTRRYGGYIVHFGVIVVMIGFAGAALQSGQRSRKSAYGDKMTIGNYDTGLPIITRRTILPTTPANGPMLDVYQERQADRHADARAPVSTRRASRPPPCRSSVRTFKEDLYLVYEGQNQEKGQPIIKAHVNPLVDVDLDGRMDHARRHRLGAGAKRSRPGDGAEFR